MAIDEEITCTATGTAGLGHYANVATVTGTDPAGAVVTDDDPSHHFGVDRRLAITKFVNGEDANEPPGLDIPEGETVVMTFEVTNPGNVPLFDVVVTDDQGLEVTFTGGDTNGDGAFDPGEVWTFEAIIGPATPGRFDNVGTVVGHDGLEVEVTADDPAFAGTVAPPPAPAPPAPEPPGPGPDPAPAGPSGALPRTGADALRLVLLGLVLVAAGLAVRRGARAWRRHGHRGAGFGPGRHGRHAAPRR